MAAVTVAAPARTDLGRLHIRRVERSRPAACGTYLDRTSVCRSASLFRSARSWRPQPSLHACRRPEQQDEGRRQFETWRAARLEEALADLSLPEGRKPTRALLARQAKAAAPYPADLLDCLQKDTTWLRSHGWNRPPGSRRVFYWRPTDAVSIGALKMKAAVRSKPRVEAMLLSLTNDSRNDHALPPVNRTLPQAELLHRAFVGIAARRGTPPPELTGRDGNGRPLGGPHEHAHINPLDLDGDGHLDHILVWAPGGLGADAQAAIRAARTTFAKGGIEPLRLALAATGGLSDLVRLPGEYCRRIDRLTRSTSSWQSVTPFVPPRYVKARGKNSLEGQIRAELRSRGFPDPVAMERLAPIPPKQSDTAPAGGSVTARDATAWRRFRHFKFVRQRGPEPPFACGFAIRLEFEHPIPGPIAIGYGSHFGLGLFERSRSNRSVVAWTDQSKELATGGDDPVRGGMTA